MITMEQKLVKDGLTETTATQYVKRLMRLNRNKPFTSLVFIRKPKDIMVYLKDEKFSPSSMESYLAMIISILKRNPSKQNDIARKEYEEILDKPDEYFTKRERGVKTDNQKKGWIEKEVFNKYIEEAKEKGLTASRKKTTFTTKDYNDILNYFIVSLYTLLPPRRNKDYQLMKIDTEEGNRYDTKSKCFYFSDYKTSGTYGEQKIDLNEYPDFLKVMKIYLKRRPNDNDYLLVEHDGSHFKLVNTMTRKLNKIFGGNKVGSTAIRSMYLTTKYGGEQNEEMKKDAHDLGHSIATQQTQYVKTE
tara:strand:- start:887 stop:1795 length:909 start_codon:yes stop_codon:yes gene_type:complete